MAYQPDSTEEDQIKEALLSARMVVHFYGALPYHPTAYLTSMLLSAERDVVQLRHSLKLRLHVMLDECRDVYEKAAEDAATAADLLLRLNEVNYFKQLKTMVHLNDYVNQLKDCHTSILAELSNRK